MAEANLAAIERIKAAKNKSLKLMRMDSNGTLDGIVKGKRDVINTSINEGVELVSNPNIGNMPVENTKPINVGRGMVGAGASNIPSEIVESFRRNPPASDADMLAGVDLADGKSLSVLDEMIGPKVQTRTTPAARNVVQEAVVQQPVQYSSQIDYPMIRTIVEEIVRKYTGSLSKKLISEGVGAAGELNTLSIGKTFKFLDSKGNIFEAQLKKIGNINDRKKVND